MYWNDQEPPHFHAVYSGEEALVRIDDGALVAGTLPRTAARLVEEWRAVHHAELADDWERAPGARATELHRRSPVGFGL
jgi:hypothetical protein